jgi:iron complex transport system substrate-binding protein
VRAHACDFPADVADLPALTSARVDSSLPSEALDRHVRQVLEARLPIYELDDLRLSALAPDVVVTQAACEVCAISYDQVVTTLRRRSFDAAVVSLQPARMSDVLEDVRTVAEACGVAPRGERLAALLRERLAAVAAAVPAGPRPRVAVVEWLSPPMLAAHWVPDAVAAAGGAPLGPEAGLPSPYATWDEIQAMEPDAVVVAPCGFDLARTLAEAAPLADRLRRLAPRVLLMDGNAYLNRPGPRLVEAVETIAAWLAGRAWPAARAVAWEPVHPARFL